MATSPMIVVHPLLVPLISQLCNQYQDWSRLQNRMSALTNNGSGPFTSFESEFGLTSGSGSVVYTDMTNVINYLKACSNILKYYDNLK